MYRKSLNVGLWIAGVLSAVTLSAAAGDARLADAAMRTDRDAIRSLLQQKVDVNAGQADGTTALHWAVRQDDLETAQMLIGAGAKVDASSRYGVTPLYLACVNAFEDHIKLMFDLLALAYQSETTRVATLMVAKDLSPASYPASGNRGGFHGASHHANVKANMDSFALINKYHVQMLAYFIEKLSKTPDGDGTLFDHSMILYGSSMSNGNQHDHDPLPIVLLGGASGQLQGNRHIVTPAHTPMSNLLLSMLYKLGVQRDSFGDSTGKLEI